MEVLSSRVLLHPNDFERSLRFYSESLGLHIYREWGSGSNQGVVFFLGGGFSSFLAPRTLPQMRTWACGCRCETWTP